MIQSISLSNFQSHKDSTLEFSPGVNIICGPSFGGKSSLLRAIRWVRENRPLGNGIISYGTKGCSVKCTILSNDKAIDVTHSKGNTSNEYEIGKIKYTAMGTTLPKEVISLFNWQNENCQTQSEIYYLALDSPGIISDVINNASHLESAEYVSRELERNRRDATKFLTNLDSELEKIDKELKEPKFEHLAEFKKLAETHAQLRREIDKDQVLLQELEKQVATIKDIHNLVHQSDVGITSSELNVLVEEYNTNQRDIENLENKLLGLRSCVNTIKELEKAEARLSQHIENTKLQLQSNVKLIKTCPVCNQSLKGKEIDVSSLFYGN